MFNRGLEENERGFCSVFERYFSLVLERRVKVNDGNNCDKLEGKINNLRGRRG